MKKGLLLLLAVLLLPVVSFAEGQKEEASGDQLKVAALLPGPINDGGWNTNMYDSLKLMEKELGAKIAYTERTPASDYEEIFRGYAASGYNIVFGHGFEFGEPAEKVAREFPEVTFIITSTSISQPPNLGSFLVDDFQCGFVQGAVAAILSKSRIVGYVGGMEIPPIVNQSKGFVAGAKYVDKSIDAKALLTGSFEDIAKAKEMSKSLIAEGADILVADADESNHGVIEAVEEAGALVIGSSGDIYETVPDARDVILTSMTENMPKGLTVLAKSVVDGTFEAKNYIIGLHDGAVALAPFRDNANLVSADQKAQIDKIIQDLRDGTIDLNQYK